MFKCYRQIVNMNSVDKKLIPKPDEEGLLRAYGRLHNIRSLPYDIRNLVILAKGRQMVTLLLKDPSKLESYLLA